VVGVLSDDTDADLALTSLVFCLVGLLPLGTAWSVLLLVTAARSALRGCRLSRADGVVSYRVGSSV
jgi:hypothetical protein